MPKEADTSISFALGLLAGVVGGIVGAVLLAPQSGEKTREDLMVKMKKIKNNFPKKIECAKNKSLRTIEKTKVSLENMIEDMHESIKAKKMANAKLMEAKKLKEQN